MKKNDIFTFQAPNGVEIAAIVLTKIRWSDNMRNNKYLCYAQNRLFWYNETFNYAKGKIIGSLGDVLVDYVILPDYDSLLDNYKSKEI